MKTYRIQKNICCVYAVVTLFACTQVTMSDLSVQAEADVAAMKELPKYRTYEEALAVAQDAMEMLGENSTTRSGRPRCINTDDVQYIVNTSTTRSSSEPDTLMYVFNYEDNAGFAVVSANRATEELIAVTEQGNYAAAEETDNEGFNMYMNMAENYIATASLESLTSLNDPGTLADFQVVTIKTVLTNYGPFVTVKWGQGYPYNLYCFDTDENQALAGCVATAIAQVLSYYKHPASIQIIYELPAYNQALDWADICAHRVSSTCLSCTSHSAQIGRLFRQIGFYVSMDYGTTVSTAWTEDARYAFNVFGYTCGSYQPYSTSIAINSLSQNQIVLMRGYDADRNTGHAWVLDGYQYVRIDKTEYTKPEGSDLWIKGQTHSSYAAYNHLNWGWDGDCNGYYLTTVYDTQACDDLDFGVSSATDYNFSISLKMIPYISKQ